MRIGSAVVAFVSLFPTYVLADVGFKDLVPGAPFSVVSENCDNSICYELKDLHFRIKPAWNEESKSYDVIEYVLVDLGSLPSVDLVSVLSGSNPYTNLRKSMDEKYLIDWEFTERQRQLFNEGDLEELFVSYEGGKAFIKIFRNQLNLSLSVEYYNAEDGAEKTSERKPNDASASDF